MEKKISIGRYACYMGIVLVVLCGLTALLSSCESDLPGGRSGKGEKIELRFTLGDISYGEGETEARSYGAEPETVVVPWGDGLYLYATLESDPADRLRAAEPILEDTKVMIVAYADNGAFVGAAEYKVTSSGTIAPTAVSGRGISVPVAGNYSFVAYSYNNTTSPPAYSSSPVAVAFGNGNDLLWGETPGTVSVNEGTNTVSIGSLKHKFSQVKIKVTSHSASTITAAAATLGTVYNGSLNLSSGGLDKGSVASPSTASFAFSTVGSTVVTSDPGLAFTKGDQFTVTLTSITIGSETKTNISATFTNTPLEEGKRYTLSLTLKPPIVFAASNIYWEDTSGTTGLPGTGYLTFDKGTPTPATMKKQGVFFKFGSLVGISPAQVSGSDLFDANTVLYIPDYNSTTKTTTWSSPTAGTKGWNWQDILYFSGAPTGTGDRQDDSVIKSAYNSFANWQAYKGDICQFIDPAYRLPYSYEFGDGYSNWNNSGSSGWTTSITAGNNQGLANGTALFDAYMTHTATGYCFPATGNRTASAGALEKVYSIGHYWTGSASTFNNNTRALSFTVTSVAGSPGIANDREFAFAVRCVKK